MLRLRQVERALAGSSFPTEPSKPLTDPEEGLRELMVQHLPRVSSLNADRRARVCSLLAGLEAEAAGSDMRFLDAFNTWFERLGASWQGDRGWQQVLRAYAAALQRVIADLQNGSPVARESQSQTQHAVDLPSSAQTLSAGRRRVLVLAGHWAAAWRIVRDVRTVSGIDLHVLICNETSASSASFVIRQAAVAATTGLRGVAALVAAMCQGRLHVRSRRLHDDATLAWLRTKAFWVGLHAMGVIYREPLFAAFGRGVLNAHIGLLPEYRGRSVMEWSILAGAPTGISVFFMDTGIDTGRDIVLRRACEARGADVPSAKASLFGRDGELYADALRRLVAEPAVPMEENRGGRRYYVMSGLLTSVVDSILAGGYVRVRHAGQAQQNAA